MANSADRFLSGFAESWRGEQQRLWAGPPHGDRAAQFAALELAWQQACDRWWHNLRHVVPQALAPALEAALRQSQVCLSLALRGEALSAADLAQMVSPAAGLHAAIRAQQQHETLNANTEEHDYVLASQAMMACIAQVTQHALQAARERLRADHDSTPREIYAHCAQILEATYREQASGDEFARLLGQWVNAHVSALAARRNAPTSNAAAAAGNTLARPDSSFAQASNRSSHAESQIPDAAPLADSDPLSRQVARQMREFSSKLAAGASSLAALAAEQSPDGGISASEVVYKCDGVTLRRYHGASRAPRQASTLPPLLVVYSLVNRPYILDLDKERSFIGALRDAGRDVYLLDWGYPREQDKNLGLDDYINRYLANCVTFLQDLSGRDTVDLIGICQGGPFALCYTALEPARVRRLALLVAPFDFHAKDFLLSQWLRHIDVDALVSTLGNVPGHLLNWSFIALKPVSLSGTKALELLDLLDRPRELATYARMERWLQDSPDQAGKAFAEFTQMFVRDNALVNATARIGARAVDLRAVQHKVLNVYAARDHIVPPSASRALPALLVNAQCSSRQVDCGHIGAFAGRRARTRVADILNEWFARDE